MTFIDPNPLPMIGLGRRLNPVADSLVSRPVRSRAIGTIPMITCAFVGCEFHAPGFTGNETILEQILAIPTSAS